ncbi:MAG: hypothetical protein O7C72_01320 [Deltaproteobacteria bacterium]|nr:hypothetical protein [Deltaproteobacteria bacterium]
MRSQLYSRKTLGVKSLSLVLNNQTKKVVFGLCITSIVLSFPVSIHAIPLFGTTNELEKRIEGIEKKQNELEQEMQVATKVYEAKWEILIFTLILLLGGGGAVYFAIYKLLGGMLQGQAEHLGKNLSRKLDSEMVGKLKEEMIFSEVRMRSSHAYIYADIAEAYTPQSRPWRLYLESAVEQNKEALEGLKKLPETFPKWKRRKCVASSNLAYCLVLLGDPTFREEVFEHAKYAKENASEFTDGYHWEDTYGWALLVYARNEDERREGIDYLETLYSNPAVPQGWVTERREKLEEFLRDHL